MQSNASTVEAYLRELPDDRRLALQRVREVILQHLPTGYEEVMAWGMITYQIPLSRYENTYNKRPLMYAALASQKNYMAVYMTGLYLTNNMATEFEEAYRASGKKLDMGKSCIRFKKLEDLPLEIIGEYIERVPVETYLAHYEKRKA